MHTVEPRALECAQIHPEPTTFERNFNSNFDGQDVNGEGQQSRVTDYE